MPELDLNSTAAKAVLEAVADKIKSAVGTLEKDIEKKEADHAHLLQKQNEEIAKYGGTLTETVKQLKAHEERYEKLTEDMRGEFQSAVEKALEELKTENSRLPQHQKDLFDGLSTLGERFVESEAYQDAIQRKGKGVGKEMELESLMGIDRMLQEKHDRGRLIKGISDTDVLRDFIATTRLLEVFRDPDRPEHIRDFLPRVSTMSNSVEYLIETVFTNAAAPVTEGEQKSETAITITDASAPVRTIAHWMAINNQILEDLNFVRGYIDQRLYYGLLLKEDQQFLYGSGLAPNIEGIMNNSGIQELLLSEGEPGDTMIDAVRRGLNLARLSEYYPDRILMHPTDWMNIELTKDDDKRYIWISVNDRGVARLWRVPVHETTALVQGDCLIGNFRLGAILLDRRKATITVTDSHSDYFIRNRTVVLCEQRVGLMIPRPKAFVRLTFDGFIVS